MSYEAKPINKEEWQSCIDRNDTANFLHSWEWGVTHEAIGKQVHRIGFFDANNNIVGVMLGIVFPAKRGKYIEVPGGPVIDWTNAELVTCAVETMRALALAERCVFVRVRPQLHDGEHARDLFKNEGFRRAGMHLHAEHTTILDVTQEPEVLLAHMRKQTRYEVRKAERMGIRVDRVPSADAIGAFHEIQQATARRQGFIPPTKSFLQAQAAAFADYSFMYQSYQGETLLSMALIIFYGTEAVYHEGASTPEGRNAPGTYAIQWQAIQDAHTKGMQRYNFFGIAPDDNPNHRYAGVTLFKRGFGGEDVHYVPAHDLVINKVLYTKNWAIEGIRKKVRKL